MFHRLILLWPKIGTCKLPGKTNVIVARKPKIEVKQQKKSSTADVVTTTELEDYSSTSTSPPLCWPNLLP
jgi:hypothetical protein